MFTGMESDRGTNLLLQWSQQGCSAGYGAVFSLWNERMGVCESNQKHDAEKFSRIDHFNGQESWLDIKKRCIIGGQGSW